MGVLEQQKLANENRMRNAMSNIDFGMIRQEPSIADRALGVARRMFWGENDPRKASLLNQGVLLPDGSRGVPMKGAPKRFESVMDVVGGPLTFAGRMAKTANKGLLKKAQEMMGQGADRDAIWKNTGWFKDIDGHWKFEIDDSASGFIDEGYKKFRRKRVGSSMPIEDVFEHKKLDKAYPKSKTDYETYWDDPSNWGETPDDMGFMDTTLYRGDTYGGGGSAQPFGFGPVTLDTGWAGPKADIPSMRSSLLHELQHGIQGREGFGVGGNPEMFSRGGKFFKKIPESIKKKARKMTRQYEKLEGGSPERIKLVDKLYAMKDKYEPYGKYKRLLGEAEARNVQTRMDFSPQQRRATPPWETLDVPESEIRFLAQDKFLKTMLGDRIAPGRRKPRS